MKCPNDEHIMKCIGEDTSSYIYWCPNCGTIQTEGEENFDIPEKIRKENVKRGFLSSILKGEDMKWI